MKLIISLIKFNKVLLQNKKVLLVEGKDDVLAIESFLHRQFKGWEKSWVVAPANSKVNVQKVLKKRDDWIGVVDKDDWDADVIADKTKLLPNLWVLPRFCIENYLVLPNELWQAIPKHITLNCNANEQQLTQQITSSLEKWVRHGVLWSMVNPLWSGLRGRGFNKSLLDIEVAQDKQQIMALLTQWHDYLTPEKVFDAFEEKLAQVLKLPIEQQLSVWVHGKVFYQHVVSDALTSIMGQQKANERQILLFKQCDVPNDFEPLWQMMELQR